MASFLKDMFHGASQALPGAIDRQQQYNLRARQLEVQEEANRLEKQRTESLTKTRQQQRDLNVVNAITNVKKLSPKVQRVAFNALVDKGVIPKDMANILSAMPDDDWKQFETAIADKTLDVMEVGRMAQGDLGPFIPFLTDALKKQREAELYKNAFAPRNNQSSTPSASQPKGNTAVQGGGSVNRILGGTATGQSPAVPGVRLPSVQMPSAAPVTPSKTQPPVANKFQSVLDGLTRGYTAALQSGNQELADKFLTQIKSIVDIQDKSGVDLSGDAKNRFLTIKANNPNLSDAEAMEMAVKETDSERLKRSREQGTFVAEEAATAMKSNIDELNALVNKVFTSSSFTGRVADTFRNLVGSVLQSTARDEDVVLYREFRDAIISNFARALGGEKGVLTDRDREFAKGFFPREFGFGGVQEKREVAERKMDLLHKKFEQLRINVLRRQGITPKGSLSDSYKRQKEQDKKTLIDLGGKKLEDLSIEELKAIKRRNS